MIRNKTTLRIQDVIILFGILFSAAVGLLDMSVNKIALYVVLPFIFCMTFLSRRSLLTNRYMNTLTMLFVWILISVLWATSVKHAMVQVKQIMGAFILCYIYSVQGTQKDSLPWLYTSFLVILLGDWYYAYNHMFDVLDLGVDRLDDKRLNANTFAYHTFYATFATFILGELNIKVKRIMRMLFFLMIPLSFVTAIFTASRQVFVIQVPLILLLLHGRYFKYKSLKVKVISILFLLVSAMTCLPKVMEVYNDSKLKERNSIEIKEDGRILLLKDAIRIGNDHFPLGVGANNFVVYSYNKGFSHNTYLELYVNEGIIGVSIYIYLMLSFIITQWKRYRRTKDLMYYYFLLAGIFFAVDGFFYVFYPYLWLIGFFILISTHSECYYKNNKVYML